METWITQAIYVCERYGDTLSLCNHASLIENSNLQFIILKFELKKYIDTYFTYFRNE